MGEAFYVAGYILPFNRAPDFDRCRDSILTWSAERMGEIRRQIANMNGDEDSDIENSAIEEGALEAIEAVESAYKGSNVSSIMYFELCDGMNIEVLVAGGSSWGDPPFEAWDSFCAFGDLYHFDKVW